jgi:hypothetical protein
VLLSYLKGRTGEESLTLSPRASRLLGQWLRHSELLRTHATPELRGRFWLAATYQCTVAPPGFSDTMLRKWVRHQGLVDDRGAGLVLHKHRTRTTYHAERATHGWSGHATIDPNHSPQVEGDRYLAVSTLAQRAVVNEIITDAQADLLRRAEPPVVLTDVDTAELVERYPSTVADLALDDEAIRDLVAGQRDVFTAACADQLAGLHGPKGKPCPARPVGLPALPAGGVRAPTSADPVAAQGFLRPPVPADAARTVRGGVRPLPAPLSADVLPRFAPITVEQARQHVTY